MATKGALFDDALLVVRTRANRARAAMLLLLSLLRRESPPPPATALTRTQIQTQTTQPNRYWAVVVAGAATFGGSAPGFLLSGYSTSDSLALAARLATVVSVLTAYPLFFVTLRSGVRSLLAGARGSSTSTRVGNAASDGGGHDRPLSLAMLATITALALSKIGDNLLQVKVTIWVDRGVSAVAVGGNGDPHCKLRKPTQVAVEMLSDHVNGGWSHRRANERRAHHHGVICDRGGESLGVDCRSLGAYKDDFPSKAEPRARHRVVLWSGQ